MFVSPKHGPGRLLGKRGRLVFGLGGSVVLATGLFVSIAQATPS